MNGRMRQRRYFRYFNVRQRVITVTDIRTLAGVVNDIAEEIHDNGEHVLLDCRITEFDGSESRDVSLDMIDAQDGLLIATRVRTVEVIVQGQNLPRQVKIRLTHGGRRATDNRVAVMGENDTWVTGVRGRIQDVVDNWRPQQTWPRRFEVGLGLRVALAATTAYVLHAIVRAVVSIRAVHERVGDTSDVLHMVSLTIGAALGALLGLLLSDLLIGLWPDVEIQTEADHLQIQREKRKTLGRVATPIAVSVFSSLLYDFLRWLLWQP